MALKAGWLVVGGVAALAAGYAFVRRREAAAGPTEPEDPCEALRLAGANDLAVAACRAARVGGGKDDPCELLRLMGAPEEKVELCKATKAVVGAALEIADQLVDTILPGRSEADIVAHNVSVNGAVLELDPLNAAAHAAARQGLVQRFIGKDQAPILRRAVRDFPPPLHANGCIPCQGVYLSESIGFHRCLPGTNNYTVMGDRVAERTITVGDRTTHDRRAYTGGYTGQWNFGAPLGSGYANVSWDTRAAVIDPLTHPHYSSSEPGVVNDFPISANDVPQGFMRWWVCGQPATGPAGTVPSRVVFETKNGRRLFKSVEFGAESSIERPPPPPVATPGGTSDDTSHDDYDTTLDEVQDGTISADGAYVWRVSPTPRWVRRRARDL